MFRNWQGVWCLLLTVGCAAWPERQGSVPDPTSASLQQENPSAAVQVDDANWLFAEFLLESADELFKEDDDAAGLPRLLLTADTQIDPFEREAGPAPLVPPFVDGESEPRNRGIPLELVIDSVYRAYPLLEAALYTRNIAQGDHLSAYGAFDLKLFAASENEPLGYYDNYRQSVGIEQPLLSGGQFFSGYRIGRGNIQPWYKGRQTDDGGEFRSGLIVPLVRNREIDERRANLWKTDIGRHQVEAEIQTQLIAFVQAASHAYWDWVAAGQSYLIIERVLHLAQDRTDRLRRQVEEGFLDRPVLVDNLRLVAEREARLADARRRLEQAAVKLSLYLRDEIGRPMTPHPAQLQDFARPFPINQDNLGFDIQRAVQARPELRVVGMTLRQLTIDAGRARNDFLPNLDAELVASQDVGAPATALRDKSEFEMSASLFLDVPLQRRFARGRITAVDGRIGQLLAQRRMIEDRIAVDVQVAYAALLAAYDEAVEARKAVEYAEDVARVERRYFDVGRSDLLTVALREQFAAESAFLEVDALRRYFQALADYRAALAVDHLQP